MSINPGSATVLGKTKESANPLLILADALQAQHAVLSQIAANTAPEGRHIYAYEEVEQGMWVGYCLACSESQKRFVHPCLDPAKAPPSTPPASFQYDARTPSVDPLKGD